MRLTNALARLGKACRFTVSSRAYFLFAIRLTLGCVTRRGRAAFRHTLRSISLSPTYERDYPGWIRRHVAERMEKYPDFPAGHGGFSLLTTVYDTDPDYVQKVADTVFAQTLTDFEWIILDNGSKSSATRAILADLDADPRVRLLRVEENLGIIGGMRFVLERATKRWIIPMDSDDLIDPDALAIFARAIHAAPDAPLFYSDEDKVRAGEVRFEAYHKPDWDPVLFWNLCFVAHMCCIQREKALELDVYGDERANGCHDWDTFFRFMAAGVTPEHVPEIIYSWRVHAGSCSGNIFSKRYIPASHEHVLSSNMPTFDKPEHLELELSPFFPNTPNYWIRRKRVAPRPVTALFVRRTGDDAVPTWLSDHTTVCEVITTDETNLQDGLRAAAASRPEPDGLVAIVTAGVTATQDEWSWDAMALTDRFADVGVVGGRIFDEHDALWSAGEVPGFGGELLGVPDRGRSPYEYGYFVGLLKQRSVRAVSGLFCVVTASLLREAPAAVQATSIAGLGARLCASAHQLGLRTVFTPFVEAKAPRAMLDAIRITSQEASKLRVEFGPFFASDPYYAPRLSRDADSPYSTAETLHSPTTEALPGQAPAPAAARDRSRNVAG